MVSNQKSKVPLLGEHWFNKDSVTNLIALSDVTSRLKVTMDSSKEKAFLVHRPDKIVRFKQLENNFYGMDPVDPESYRKMDSSKKVQK